MKTAVGNGTNTLFWDHKWATSKPLSKLATQNIPGDTLGATVEEMWEKHHGWKWNIFAPYLPSDVLKQIQSFQLKDDPDIGDLVYWQGNSKGKFTIKSALSIMRNETDSTDDECWNVVWSAPIQQRVRAFLWLSCHDRLLGNLNRYRRHMTDTPKCYICNAEEESTLHILRDCPAAKLVWRRIGGPAHKERFFHETLKQWITINLAGVGACNEELWASFFGTSLWWIWRWINAFVFGRGADIPMDIGAFIQIRVNETRCSLKELGEENHGSKLQKIQKFIKWIGPCEGWYVLNCDGAAKGAPGPAGGGMIIRDSGGTFVSAAVAFYGHCSAFRAEVLALTQGLELARDLMITQLEVQVDSLTCVQAISSKHPSQGECIHELNYCRTMLGKEDWTVKLIHVYREGNRAADWLANSGVSQANNFIILDNPPVELNRIIEEDIQGVALPRLAPP